MKIVITHGYSDSNKGDLAIVVGTILKLKEKNPDAKIIFHSLFSKSDTEFAYHVRQISNYVDVIRECVFPSPYVDSECKTVLREVLAGLRFFKSLYCCGINYFLVKLGLSGRGDAYLAALDLKSADLIIAKGGQYIYNDQGGVRGGLYLFRVLFNIYFSTLLNSNVFLLGHSVGPVRGKLGQMMVFCALRRCRIIAVRELLSKTFLSDLRLERNVIMCPDFAFNIKPSKPQDSSVWPSQGEVVGLTLVNWYFPGQDIVEKRQEYIEKVFLFTLNLHKKYGFKFALFPQVTVKHHGESDLTLLQSLHDLLSANNVFSFIVNGDYSPEELSYYYGRCEVLVGTRLHSCILALCSYTPVLAIRYQGFKTEGVMKMVGLDSHVSDIAMLDIKKLDKDFDYIYSKRVSISNNIEIKVAELRAELDIVVNKVYKYAVK